MDSFTSKDTIDDYIDHNELNAHIYQILLYLQDDKKDRPYKLERTPLEIFNQAYRICNELKKVKHPEELTIPVWKKTEQIFLFHETNIIFSCVYIILYFTGKENPNMKYSSTFSNSPFSIYSA